MTDLGEWIGLVNLKSIMWHWLLLIFQILWISINKNITDVFNKFFSVLSTFTNWTVIKINFNTTFYKVYCMY